jgi:hypothetical protein
VNRRADFQQQLKAYPARYNDDIVDATPIARLPHPRISSQGKCSRWVDENYWRGGWRTRLAGLLVDISNRWPGRLP